MRALFGTGLRPDSERGEVSIRMSSGLELGVRARFTGMSACETGAWLEDACCGRRRWGRDASNDLAERGEDGGGEQGAIGCGL